MACQIGYQFWGSSFFWNEQAAQAVYDGDSGETAKTPSGRRRLGPPHPIHPAARQNHGRDTYLHMGEGTPRSSRSRWHLANLPTDPNPLRDALNPFHELSALISDMTTHVVAEGRRGLKQEDALTIESYRKNDSALKDARLAWDRLSIGNTEGAFMALICASLGFQDASFKIQLFNFAEKIKPKIQKENLSTTWHRYSPGLLHACPINLDSLVRALQDFVENPNPQKVARATSLLAKTVAPCDDVTTRAIVTFVSLFLDAVTPSAGLVTHSGTDEIEKRIAADVDLSHQKKCLELLLEARRTRSRAKWQALHAYIKRHEPFAYQLMEEIEGVMKITRPL